MAKFIQVSRSTIRNMAKTADLVEKSVEAIIIRMTSEFSNTITNMISQFSKLLTETVNVKIETIIKRLDNLEERLFKFENSRSDSGVHLPSASQQVTREAETRTIEEIVARAVVAIEEQKGEAAARSKNVIISGLQPVRGTSDADVISKFCEENLTVKPRIVRSRRIGKSDTMPKYCITLDSPESVTDLIASSRILRQSADDAKKKVYFNHDLTKAQAEAEYQARCIRRANKNNISTLNINAPAFNGSVSPPI